VREPTTFSTTRPFLSGTDGDGRAIDSYHQNVFGLPELFVASSEGRAKRPAILAHGSRESMGCRFFSIGKGDEGRGGWSEGKDLGGFVKQLGE
jgi:hypothetical protein